MVDGHLYCICDGHLLDSITSYSVLKKARKVDWLTRKNSRNSVECARDRKDSHVFTQHPCVKNGSKQVDREIKIAWKSSFGLKQ